MSKHAYIALTLKSIIMLLPIQYDPIVKTLPPGVHTYI